MSFGRMGREADSKSAWATHADANTTDDFVQIVPGSSSSLVAPLAAWLAEQIRTALFFPRARREGGALGR